MTPEEVDGWLAAYIRAWKTYDRDDILALFAEDARYWYHPFDEPVAGREAIVASWVDETSRDPSGTYDASYSCLVVDGDTAISQGRTRYLRPDGEVDKEYDNIFVMKFDNKGRCREFREWYMAPPGQA